MTSLRRHPSIAADSRILIGRSARHMVRAPDALFISFILPVFQLLLFVYLFGGAIATGTDYVNYVTPGIILVAAGFAASLTATAVNSDLTEGLMDRLRSMPIYAWAAVIGHVVTSTARNLLVTALTMGVALMIGFQPTAGAWEWIAAVGLLALFALATTWIAVILGLVADSVEAASGYAIFISFLPFMSGAFVPTETISVGWLRAVAEHQPVTPVVETARGLLLDMPIGNSGWIAIAWCVGILLVAVPTAAWLFGRRTNGA